MQALRITQPETTKAELPTGELSVTGNLEQMEFLCGFGARQNPKRGFLFVSKVLGKHYPSKVHVMESVHLSLALKLSQHITGSTCFIGMAETAVGLSHGVFEQFIGMKHTKSCFVHSTRYLLEGYDVMDFEESHSHSPDQMIMLPTEESDERDVFDTAQTLILIDDEISTGNTLSNLSKCYIKHNPNVKRIVWVCLTDFSDGSITNIEGIPVETLNLFEGEYSFKPNENLKNIKLPADVNGGSGFKNKVCHHQYGRTGVSHDLNFDMCALLPLLETMKADAKVLVVGSGEWMHPAFLIGREIKRNNNAGTSEIFVQSTTRSPAMMFGAIQSSMKGQDTYGDEITNYLYNVEPEKYDHILFVTENPHCKQANDWCEMLNAQLCWFEDGKLVVERGDA